MRASLSFSVTRRHRGRLTTGLMLATALGAAGLARAADPLPTVADLERPDQVVTIDTAVRLALKHHGSITAAEEGVIAARERVKQSRTGTLPNVRGQVGYAGSGTSSLGGIFGSEPHTTVTGPGGSTLRQTIDTDVTRTNRGIQPRASFDWTLFDGGLTRASTRQARAGVDANVSTLGSVRNNRVFTVTSDYLTQLRAQRLLELRKEQVRLAQEQLRSVDAFIKEGKAAEADRALVLSELRNREVDQIQAENDVRVSSNLLRNSMGLPVGPPLKLVELQESTAAPPPVAELRKAAMLGRPEVLQADARVRVQRETVQIARIQRRPKLDGSFSFNLNPADAFQRGDFAFAASISMPLFDFGLTRAREDEARSDVRAAEADLAQVRKDVASEVEEAYLNLLSARERLGASRLAVDAAQVNLNVTTRRYQLGVAATTVVDLIQAQVQFANANNNAISAAYDVFLAEAQLNRSIGRGLN